MIRPTTIKVLEDNDAIVTVELTVESEDGSTAPYDFTDPTITEVEFIVRRDLDTDRTAADFTYTRGAGLVMSTMVAGRFEIHFVAADIATPGERRYQVDVVRTTRRETVMYGTLSVTNI